MKKTKQIDGMLIAVCHDLKDICDKMDKENPIAEDLMELHDTVKTYIDNKVKRPEGEWYVKRS